MDLSARLSVALADLSDALEEPGCDLERRLDSLCTALTNAVPSFIGMTITVAVDPQEVRFTVSSRPSSPRIATSLLIPLSALSPTPCAGTILLCAAVPGAFVDLAADLSHAIPAPLDNFVHDAHDGVTFDGVGVSGLDSQFTVNQALGVLIERGHTPETALGELRRQAQLVGGDLQRVAEQVLGTVAGADTRVSRGARPGCGAGRWPRGPRA